MSKTTEVALPTPVNTPALDIGADDIVLPRLYCGSPGSTHVASGDIPVGSLYSAEGKDDEDPVLLWNVKENGDEGLLVHVLGLTKGKSWTDENDQMWSVAYDDPSAPEHARTTYNYHVILPEVQTDVPYKFLLKSSGTSVARQINTVIKRAEGQTPAYAIAFRLTTKHRKQDQYQWYVPVVRSVEADPKHIEAAATLAGQLAASAPAPRALPAPSNDDAPEI